MVRPLAFLRTRAFVAWLLFAIGVVAISWMSGWRASRAAGAPQYLFCKARVLVDEPLVPVDAADAELLAQFTPAERPTQPVFRPMLVFGLLDGAAPVVAVAGLIALVVQRRSIAEARRPPVT